MWTELAPAVVMINDLATMLEEDNRRSSTPSPPPTRCSRTYLTASRPRRWGRRGATHGLAVWDKLGSNVPFLQRHRHEYEVARVDEHFLYGLDALLAGLTAARRG